MFRTLPACAALLLLTALGHAQDPAPPTELVIKLTVHPAASPKPALKYHLLPELKDMEPGNPAQGYMKCFMEQHNFYYGKESVDEREKWLTAPLKDLPAASLLDYGGYSLRQADRAARLTTLDWQILGDLRRDGIGALLPEIQMLRMLASALKVRMRAQVACGHFDDAIRTSQTIFAISHHLGEHPTLIGSLVGLAIANVGIGPLEEFLQQPGAPNLYWALTDLPDPMISIRRGLEGERQWEATEFAWIDEKAPMGQEKLAAAVQHYREISKYAEGDTYPKGDIGDWLNGRAKDEALVAAARKRLTASGLDADLVKRFPPLQIILLDEKLKNEMIRDEEMKAMALPFWQAEPIIARAMPAKKTKEESLFGWMLPATEKCRLAQTRLEQRIRMLRCVEALRLYAAAHGGKLPAKLSDVEVPLSVDPVTGREFLYKLEGETAHLRGSPPPGFETNAPYNVHYEITIVK